MYINIGLDMAPQQKMMDPKNMAVLGFKLTHPAIVALVGYLILLVMVLLPFDMHTYDVNEQKYVRVPYNFPYRLLIALLLMLPFFLGVYSINCMMVGNCVAWSWIVAILTIVWAFVIAIVAFSLGSFSLDQLV
jgi:uncharacterized membrane protein (DUF485 family)